MGSAWVQRVRFSDQAKNELRQIIKDRAGADRFIKAAQTAVATYRTCRRFLDPHASRADIQRLLTAAVNFRSALERVRGQQTPRIDADALLSTTADVIAQARIELAKPPAPKGRRHDGPGIILIKDLARAFESCGLRASTGERSLFMKALTAINNDQLLSFTDLRRKARAALRGIKYKNLAI